MMFHRATLPKRYISFLLKLLLFTIIIFHTFVLKGQQERLKFSKISVEDGLSQSSAFALAQDSLGYIWIATYDGLNKYSGYEMTIYRNKKGDPNSLPDNFVQALAVDSSGRLWAGTNGHGVCIFNHALNRFINLPVKQEGTGEGLEGRSVLTLKYANNHRMVALTEKGINIIDTKSLKCKLVSADEYSAMGNMPSLTSYFNKKSLQNEDVNFIFTDSKENVWIATNHGLKRKLAKSLDTLTYLKDPSDKYSLSANDISCIMEDRGGLIWIGTSLGGVSTWDCNNKDMILYQHSPSNANSISNSKTRCFYEDSKDQIWIGTVEKGLNLWDRKNDLFTHWHTGDQSGLNNNHIRDIVEWNGKYVLAMDGGGVQTFDATSSDLKFTDLNIKGLPKNARVWDLCVDGENLWISSYSHGLFCLSKDSSINYQKEFADKKVTWVCLDNEKNIWIGTFGHGLFLKTADSFRSWNPSNSGIDDDRIYGIVPDSNHILWLGTKGGLIQFNSETEEFRTYTERDGLPNNTITGIVLGQGTDLWLSSNGGISHFTPSEKKITNYDISDGLQDNEFLVHAFLKLSSGEILFGGINGFNVFPVQGPSSNPYAPQVVITNFDVPSDDWHSDSAADFKKMIHLEYDQNEFSFGFAALSYADIEKNTYAYKLEGYDQEWKSLGTRRFIQYTNIAPGFYSFLVKAANNDGVWAQKPTSVNIKIKPAFWQTLWFKVLCIIAFIIILIIIYQVRIKQISNKNKWLESVVAERTKDIVARQKEIEEKNQIIESAYANIKDSIKYAKRIQQAILPPNNFVKEVLKNSFILYKPKDIVAGDFYWIEKKDGILMFAAADCTGHGVPGAMVSVVCHNALNRSVREQKLRIPGEILDRTREIVIQEFKKADESVSDGMDIALCTIQGQQLLYAGAYNPLWIIRAGKIIETKANKQPIGIYDHMKPFTTHQFPLEENDTIYIFSDGYADQFGGRKGKKLKTLAFKKLLLEIQGLSMAEQKTKLNEFFNNWKGALDQIDDVCVIGLRYNQE